MKIIRSLRTRWHWFYVITWIFYGVMIAFWRFIADRPPTEQFLSDGFTTLVSRIMLILLIISLISSIVLYVTGTRDYLRSILLFLVTFVIMVLALGQLVSAPPDVSSLDSKSFGGHQYNFASYITNDQTTPDQSGKYSQSKTYILYQCDSWDITCAPVFTRKYALQDSLYFSSKDTFISTDGGKLSLQINGEVVYTSSP